MTKIDMRKYDDPSRSTRLGITAGLVVGGAVAGAVFGAVLTPLGKIVAGAPPADVGIYIWNATSFAIFGAVLAPIVTWAGLRRAPLWRTIVEPLAGAIAGVGLGVIAGSPLLFLLGFPVGAAAAAARLAYAHRNRMPDAPRLPDIR